MIEKTLLFVVAILAYGPIVLAIEPGGPSSDYEEIYQLKTRINEDKFRSGYQELNLSSWPNSRPVGTSKTITVERFNSSFDLYIWWQEGYLLAEAVVLNGTAPFICGAGWNIVQSVSNVATLFDTIRFETQSGDSLCEEVTSSQVFAIVQWEYIFDYYADFNEPFNLVSNRNPYDLVRVNGGVTTATTSTPSTPGAGTVSPDLSISIPSIEYKSLSGTSDIYLELQFNGETAEGVLTWILLDAGFN